MDFQINVGTVQAYIVDRDNPCTYHHFGNVEYDRNKPILKESERIQAQEICNDLNFNEITFKDAQKKLDKI